MYTHSMTYSFDNYTNTGILGTLAVSKNLFLQAGVTVGTDTAFWNAGKRRAKPFLNPLYPVADNAIAQGGTPCSPRYLPFNAPGTAQCNDPNALRCDVYV